MNRCIRDTAMLLLLTFGFPAAAMQNAVVDGRWEGVSMTANGTVTVAYNFKVKGALLTGNGETPAGSQPITEGKVEGNSISFKTEINGHVIEHHGTISGDTLRLKNFGPGGEFDLKLTHVSSEKKSAPQ